MIQSRLNVILTTAIAALWQAKNEGFTAGNKFVHRFRAQAVYRSTMVAVVAVVS